jgi:hypothetical protein
MAAGSEYRVQDSDILFFGICYIDSQFVAIDNQVSKGHLSQSSYYRIACLL